MKLADGALLSPEPKLVGNMSASLVHLGLMLKALTILAVWKGPADDVQYMAAASDSPVHNIFACQSCVDVGKERPPG